MDRETKHSTFFGGAAVLALGIIVVKLIGMFYKIPLVNIIGEAGNADFGNAYNIYAVLLTISTAGLPVAVSKMVSEASAVGNQAQEQKVFKVSLMAFLTLGIISFLVMYFGADALAGMMHDSLAAPGIRALAPAVICVGCLGAFRGYSQGHSDMAPTSISQIIEALCKLIIGLGLAYFTMKQVFDLGTLAKYRPELDTASMTAEQISDAIAATQASQAAAGAIRGVTIGTIMALIYMAVHYFWQRKNEPVRRSRPAGSTKEILRTLISIAVPITLSSSMVGIVTVVDSSLVQGQLQHALKLTEDASRALYGNYAAALNIYNLPTSLMAAVTASVIPAVSGALARSDRRDAARISGSALRISALLAIPMGVGLYALGTPIIRLLYPRLNVDLAGALLSTLGIATPLVCVMLVCNSVLQAYGFINLPVIVMLAGGIIKIITNYNLVGYIGITGAPVGNILCFGICLLLDLYIISRVIPGIPKFGPIFLKPLSASAIMGVCAWGIYSVISHIFTSPAAGEAVMTVSRMGNALAVLAAILAAVAVYLVLILAMHCISRDDLMLMPKGEKIASLLKLDD